MYVWQLNYEMSINVLLSDYKLYQTNWIKADIKISLKENIDLESWHSTITLYYNTQTLTQTDGQTDRQTHHSTLSGRVVQIFK